MLVLFGDYTTRLSHWQDESFYARSPTRLTFDWLLTFRPAEGDSVPRVVVRHIGWDLTEQDHAFQRTPERW